MVLLSGAAGAPSIGGRWVVPSPGRFAPGSGRIGGFKRGGSRAPDRMKRREFLRTAGGAAGAATATSAAAGPAAADGSVLAAQEDGEDSGASDGADGSDTGEDGADGNESEGGGLPGAGDTQEIVVGPGGDLSFDPDNVEVLPGTTVVWTWDSDGHNVAPDGIPEGAEWEGHPEIVGSGSEYQHTFTTEGTYDYVCTPHVQNGMVGSVVVTEDADSGGGGGGYEPPDPAHMGIPVQKHFVGALAFMGIFVTLVFTFYVLKYGESAHTAAPSKRD